MMRDWPEDVIIKKLTNFHNKYKIRVKNLKNFPFVSGQIWLKSPEKIYKTFVLLHQVTHSLGFSFQDTKTFGMKKFDE